MRSKKLGRTLIASSVIGLLAMRLIVDAGRTG